MTLLLSLCLTVPQDFSKGPPVVLFPSLAGSVLECQASPVEGFDLGTRIWMGLSTLLGAHTSGLAVPVPLYLAVPLALVASVRATLPVSLSLSLFQAGATARSWLFA